MQWREPLYLGRKARPHQARYRQLLETLSETAYKTLNFYVIVSPANEQNLMELIPASHLKQNYYRADTMSILGLAADKKEAFDLCHKMIRDCYVGNGVIDKAGLWGNADPSASDMTQRQSPSTVCDMGGDL